MPLIKLNRPNNGGPFMLNSEHILSVESKDKTTVINLVNGEPVTVAESPLEISGAIEQMHTDRIKNAIAYSGLAHKPL